MTDLPKILERLGCAEEVRRALAAVCVALVLLGCASQCEVPPVLQVEDAGDHVVDNAILVLQRKANPTLAPVKVEWYDDLLDKGRLGETEVLDGELIVRLQRDLSGFSRERLERYVKLAVLMHEWGHALSIGSGAVGDSSHDAMFGVGVARAYRALYELGVR